MNSFAHAALSIAKSTVYSALCAALVTPLALAKEEFRANIGAFGSDGAQLFHDEDANDWTLHWMGRTFKTEWAFDDVTVHWTEPYGQGYVALLSGQHGRMCEMAFTLLTLKADGTVTEDAEFSDTCYAESVQLRVVANEAIITLDAEQLRLPLEPDLLGNTPNVSSESATDAKECYEAKVNDFRQEMGADTPINHGVMSEWRSECDLPLV